MKAILTVVESHEEAGNVVASLRLQGFPSKFLSILFQDESRLLRARGNEPAVRRDCGGALGFFSNVAPLSVPGIGPVIAAGALSDLLKETPGGLAACLVSLRLPYLLARQCERDVRAGHIVIAVHVEHPRLQSFVRDIFEREAAVSACAQDEIPVTWDVAA